MRRTFYIGSCVELPGEHITEMVDAARQITYRTFMAHVDRGIMESLFPEYNWPGKPGNFGLWLCNDWHVSYYRSTYRGRRCYFIEHSAIEYIFAEGK